MNKHDTKRPYKLTEAQARMVANVARRRNPFAGCKVPHPRDLQRLRSLGLIAGRIRITPAGAALARELGEGGGR